MSDITTPDPTADGGPRKVGFQDLWNECDNQRRRYGIWRDHFAAEADAAASHGDRAEYVGRLTDLARDRGRLADTYDTMARLIERVRDDSEILDRLRLIANAEARRAEFEKSESAGDEVAADE
jgi:hypothetical protein